MSCRSQPVVPIDSAGLLQPQFWTAFQGSLGCSGIHLTTWNSAGTVGMDIHIPVTPTDLSSPTTFNLGTRDAIVMVETGQEIPLNFCVDETVEIPVQQVYHSQKGVINLSLEQKDNQSYATVKLSGVELKSEYANHSITMPEIQLPDVSIGPIRAQTSNRPRLQHANPP